VEKTAALELIRQRVCARIGPVIEAQLDEAEGSRCLVVRSPHGGYRRVTDEQQIEAALAAGETVLRIYQRPPNPAAFVALMNRIFGTPADSVKLMGPEGGNLTIRIKKPW